LHAESDIESEALDVLVERRLILTFMVLLKMSGTD